MRPCVFGPVPSRRLGRSLGVDVTPFKTCPYDCVYCQLGDTTAKRVRRGAWVSVADTMKQLRRGLKSKPDIITVSGSGEPTLYVGIGKLITAIKRETKVPVAVLTNGALLSNPAVRRELLGADVVCPSLDAGDSRTFRRVNRPHAALSFREMVKGLVEFRNEFWGKYWLEVLLLEGITDTKAQVKKIAALARRIRPDRVHLNTVARPPADSSARPVTLKKLRSFAPLFNCPTDVVASPPKTKGKGTATPKKVLSMLRRRPCTVEDVALGLGLTRMDALKLIGDLRQAGRIRPAPSAGRKYYKAVN